jgi:hypothetical protein
MRLLSTLLCGLCAFALSTVPAFAQTPQAPPSPTFGLEGGVDWSHVSPAGTGETISNEVGAVVGAFVALPISKSYRILIEGQYIQKHSKHEFTGLTSDLKIDYFEVPVLVKMPLFKGIFMTEGVGFAFPVSAKVSAGGTDTDVKNSVTNPDVSIIIGGGYPITPHAAIELRYDGGFRNVDQDANATPQKNRTWMVMLRWQK